MGPIYAMDLIELGVDDRRCVGLNGKVYRAKRQGENWSVEIMLKPRSKYSIKDIQNEICENLTIGNLVTGGLTWIQISVEGLDTHVVRIPIADKVAYLEKKVYNDQGQLEALERVENWETVLGGEPYVGGAVICERVGDDADNNAEPGEEASTWSIKRLKARDLLAPTPVGQGFLDALANVGNAAKEGLAEDDDKKRLIHATGVGRRMAKRPKRELVDEEMADEHGSPEHPASPEPEGGADSGDDMVVAASTGRGRGRGRGRGGRGRGRGRGRVYSGMVESEDDDDTPVMRRNRHTENGPTQILQKGHNHVTLGPPDHIGAAAAPGLGRLINWLVDRTTNSNDTESFDRLLQLCSVLPMGSAAIRQGVANGGQGGDAAAQAAALANAAQDAEDADVAAAMAQQQQGASSAQEVHIVPTEDAAPTANGGTEPMVQ